MSADPRTVYLAANPPANAAELRWPDKSPGETVFARFNASRWLDAVTGDNINPSTIAITSTPADLTFAGMSCDGVTIQWQLSGGVVPETGPINDYTCNVIAQTAQGCLINENVYVRVYQRSQNAGYATPISVLTGPPGPPGSGLTGGFSIDGGDIVLNGPESTSVTFTGLMAAIDLATSSRAAARTAKPSGAGTFWNSGGIIEVSDGSP